MGGSVALMSDYRYRGYSLTAEKPALVATLLYDHPSGAYASLAAIGAPGGGEALQTYGYQAYVGFARRFSGEASWELGATRTDVARRLRPQDRIRISEVYAGVSTAHLSGHLFYSPHYLRSGLRTLYASVDASADPTPQWRLLAHAGVLTVLRDASGAGSGDAYADVRAGVARRLGPVELQAAWTHLFAPPPRNPAAGGPSRTALVLSGRYDF